MQLGIKESVAALGLIHTRAPGVMVVTPVAIVSNWNRKQEKKPEPFIRRAEAPTRRRYCQVRLQQRNANWSYRYSREFHRHVTLQRRTYQPQ